MHTLSEILLNIIDSIAAFVTISKMPGLSGLQPLAAASAKAELLFSA
jgi:hypothetical protein